MIQNVNDFLKKYLKKEEILEITIDVGIIFQAS